MSTAELLRPILEGGIRSISFFNGRLLSGEDMYREQQANREARKLLGQAIGEGVAYGLEVSKAGGAGTAPLLTVQPGLAVNRRGDAIRLGAALDVSLLRPQNGGAPARAAGFTECAPFQAGTYVSGSGVYVLLIAPARGGEGRAPVSGLQNDAADCNTKYTVDGVQFRLLQLDLTPSELNDRDHLRSLVAHRCFGVDGIRSLVSNPFAPGPESYGILDELRPNRLTDCDVPLAVLFWTATDGIKFVDMWSVRRRLIEPASANDWTLVVEDRRRSEAEAMLLQFQDHLDAIRTLALGGTAQIAADQYFKYLPPAGYLPIGANGFDWKRFLGPHAPDEATLIDEGLFRSVIHRSLFQDAVGINPFALASQPNVAPPVPVNVYRLPGQPGFVVFARSWGGRIRVFLSPTPGPNEAVNVNATSKTGNAQFDAAVVTGPMRPIVDVPAGPYKVNVAIAGYQTVAPIGVTAIGGETIDLSVTLQKLPNGRIVVSVLDSTGASIANKVTSVIAVAGNVTRSGALSAGKWSVDDLPAGSYNLTVTAPGFKSSTLTGVQVALGETVQRTVTLVRTTGDRPPLCVEVRGVKKPLLQRARLCLVLGCYKATKAGFAIVRKSGTEQQQKKRRGEEASREDFEIESGKGLDLIGADEPPWSAMVQVEPLEPEVAKWLALWQQWFNREYPGQGIGASRPAIFINPKYITPRGVLDVPDTPQAFAVFGKFYRPLTVNVSTNTTNRPVRARKAKMRGVGDDDWDRLDKCGIKYLDQVAGLWAHYVSYVVGQPLEFSRYLILDSITEVDDVNKTRRYYDGWDSEVEAVFKDMGLTDDVAVANADRKELVRRLKSEGFADRLIKQSRGIVPEEAWSLEALGFSKGQAAALEERGIGSKGEFAVSAGTDDGRIAVAAITGIDAGQVSTIREAAISQMAASSILLAPVREITSLAGVNAAIADKLAAADVTTTEALASANSADLAAKAGLSVDVAGSLIESAKGVSRERLDIASLAPISAGDAEALRTNLGINTLGDLATRDAAAIAAAFGNDVNRARAVIEGVRVGLGGRIR